MWCHPALRRPLGALLPILPTAAMACLLGLSLIAGGCASSATAPSRVAGPTDHLPDPQIHSMRIEMEADGLPAQVALKNRAPYPDDPTEPWSPNYGKAAPSSPVARGPLAEPAPPRFDSARIARQIASAPAAVLPRSSGPQMDPDEIIRRAIAEHEMRRN